MYMFSPMSFTRSKKRKGGSDSSTLHLIILAEVVDDDSRQRTNWDGRVL